MIYVHDQDGRVDQEFEERIDGSFGDADQIERLLAMRMYQLGVHRAESITFNSDGAKWLWDRIDAILARAKVPNTVLIFKILDVYHAAENLNKGIKAMGKCPVEAIPAGANGPSAVWLYSSRNRRFDWCQCEDAAAHHQFGVSSGKLFA